MATGKNANVSSLASSRRLMAFGPRCRGPSLKPGGGLVRGLEPIQLLPQSAKVGKARARGNPWPRSRTQQPGVRRGNVGACMAKRDRLDPVSLLLKFIRWAIGVASTIQLQAIPPRVATTEPAECHCCAQANRSPSVLVPVRFQTLRCRGPPRVEQPGRFV